MCNTSFEEKADFLAHPHIIQKKLPVGRVEVMHSCGHVEVVRSFDDPMYSEERIAKLGKTKEQFVKEQIEWYASVPCPGCYVPRHGYAMNGPCC
jgi:hypothetical protein